LNATTPDITTLAAESVGALARLVSAAVLPVIQEQIAESERGYNLTIQTHLEIIQSLTRRLDRSGGALGDAFDRIEGLQAELDDLTMRARLFNNKVNILDEARSGHQNHIAGLFDMVGDLQTAMTEAEARLEDIENPLPIPEPPPQPEADAEATAYATTAPFGGMLANLGKLTVEQARDLNSERFSYVTGGWLKDWTSGYPGKAYAVQFDATGAAHLASSEKPPASCADQGNTCCVCNPCCTCGRLR
jgi:hypothetical protein